MKKVPARRLPGTLAGAVVAVCLLSGQARPEGRPTRAGAGDSPWWGVRLIVDAKGNYTVRGGPTPLAGEYACRILWEGRLEPDDDDFLLVHLRTEILEWRLRERSGPDGKESFLEAPPGSRPALRMIYVIKDGREVEFAFEVGGISIPLHASPLVIALDLPRTSARAPGVSGQGGDYSVRRGSSRIAVPEADLAGHAPERRFFWDWRRVRPFVRKGRTLTVAQDGAAEAVVAVTLH